QREEHVGRAGRRRAGDRVERVSVERGVLRQLDERLQRRRERRAAERHDRSRTEGRVGGGGDARGEGFDDALTVGMLRQPNTRGGRTLVSDQRLDRGEATRSPEEDEGGRRRDARPGLVLLHSLLRE